MVALLGYLKFFRDIALRRHHVVESPQNPNDPFYHVLIFEKFSALDPLSVYKLVLFTDEMVLFNLSIAATFRNFM